MFTVYLNDPTTKVGYAISEFEDSFDALDCKDRLRVKYHANVFYTNTIRATKFYSVEEALLLVNGKDIYEDVQS